MGWSSTLDECKDYSPEKLDKEHITRKLKALRYQKETLVCRWKKTIWWRISNA
jgi:hypothetical protein